MCNFNFYRSNNGCTEFYSAEAEAEEKIATDCDIEAACVAFVARGREEKGREGKGREGKRREGKRREEKGREGKLVVVADWR